ASMDSILARGLTALSPGAVGEIVKHQEVLLLDTRPSPSFVRSFVPGSIWVGFGSTFDSWVSRLVMDSGQPLVIVADRGSEEGVISRLAGIGFDQVLGYLNGGLEAWADAGLATGSLMEVSPEVFSEISDPPTVTMLDVRSSAEYFCQHIEGARHFPVEAIECQPDELDRDEAYFLYSQHGDRSTLAASLMLRQGFTQLVHVQGGFTEVKKWIQGVTPYREPLLMW
ncbi:MAG: rhodanese-like domain-containing protein, partial [Cyclobacteriaceae bacterium]|nr:rhodanese-like domain-containing protein [Cyclobacteriaceae bacterium]